MYNINKEIEIQVKKINFDYQLINKTFSFSDPVKWFGGLGDLIKYIKSTYVDKKIRILEGDSDHLSIFDKRIIKKELKGLL